MTSFGCHNDVKTVKQRCSNVVLTFCSAYSCSTVHVFRIFIATMYSHLFLSFPQELETKRTKAKQCKTDLKMIDPSCKKKFFQLALFPRNRGAIVKQSHLTDEM